MSKDCQPSLLSGLRILRLGKVTGIQEAAFNVHLSSRIVIRYRLKNGTFLFKNIETSQEYDRVMPTYVHDVHQIWIENELDNQEQLVTHIP